jgi:trans-aconitate methyltransferase
MKSTARHRDERMSDSRTPSAYCAARQAEAYDQLLAVYESRHQLLQPVRMAVLDRVLDGLEPGASVLEVGCGCGASMELLVGNGFKAEGIDLSPSMSRAARLRSGCRVIEADFRKHVFDRQYDLVFAQAFVHLFPKTEVGTLVGKLKALARRRVYFSTSVAQQSGEDWYRKDGVLRYRSLYTIEEVRDLMRSSTSEVNWSADVFELVDPLQKRWANVILDRCSHSG